MVSIALVEPSMAGNVGGVARVMANFGFSSLIVVNPQCDIFCEEAKKRAVRAQSILRNAKIVENIDELVKEFDVLVATTSKLGSDYNVQRSPMTPEDLESILPKKKVCILFGREDKGLVNQEIAKCDFVVTIPSSKEYSALNLVNAVAVILYFLFNKKESTISHINYASRKEREVLLKLIDDVLDNLDFTLEAKKETQKKIWQRVLGKSFLTKREVFALCGFFKKVRKGPR